MKPAATSARWPLMACALLSVAAHAVLLDVLRAAPHAGQPGTAQLASQHGALPGNALPALRVRTLAAGHDRPTMRPPQPASITIPQRAREATPDRPVDAAPDSALEPTLALAHAATPVEAPSPDTITPPPPNTPPGPDIFIPRPELTVPPMPQTPVVLNAPDGESAPARRVGVLALYIDEAGRVDHIVPDTPRLPPDYERVAREAFMHTVFTPGQQQGRVVKSRIRVEVVFDNTPLDEP